MKSRSHIVLIFAILLLAVAVRLLLIRYETEIGVDSVLYILQGNNIAHGGWDTWDTTGGRWIMPPLLPILVAIFRLMGVGLEWSGHLASMAAGVLLLIPVYILTKRLYGDRAAIAAAWIAAFTPILVDYSVIVSTELLFAACAITAMIFTHRAFSLKGTIWDVFWSGIWIGLGFLARSLGIILLPWLLISYLFGRSGPSRSRSIKRTIVALIGFVIIALPYWTALKQSTGKWVIDSRFGTYGGQELRSDSTDQEASYSRYTGELTPDRSDFLVNVPSLQNEYKTESPSAIVSEVAHRYIQMLMRIYLDFPFTPTFPNGVQLFYLFPVFLLGLGFFTGTGKWRDRDSDRFMVWWLAPFILILPLVFVVVRYYIPVVAMLMPFMAVGAVYLASWIRNAFPDARLIKSGDTKSSQHCHHCFHSSRHSETLLQDHALERPDDLV